MLNLNQLKKLYTNSPLWMKKLYASIPYEIRNGSDYRKWKKFLETEVNEEEYQLLKLKETIFYAYENTVYYKNVFNQLNLNVYDFNELKDIENLPFIDKDIVRKNYKDFIVTNYPKKKTFFVTTGGSSGEPMQFLQSKNIWYKEIAFINHFYSKYGYSPSEKRASIRGGEFSNSQINKYWNYNPIRREIHFSPFHISNTIIHHYVNQLNKLKPYFLHGYPSAILAIVDHMKYNNLKLNYKLKAIFLISENFSITEIEKISSFFNCKVTSFFGHSERIIFATLNDKNYNEYFLNKKYGFAELINEHEKGITIENKVGELVGTSFDNYAMPLIRYKTNDFTSYNKNKNFTLIQGRWNKEYLEGLNGLKLTLTALNMHSEIFKNVIYFQFLQKKVGEVILVLVPSENFSKNDEKLILDALLQKVGHSIKFSIKLRNEPIYTSRGKIKKLIKEIKEK